MRVASFGRYSGNERDGYIKRAGNYQGTEADDTHHKAIFNGEFIQRVLAIVASKLKGSAEALYNSNSARINCYYKNRADNVNLKDSHNYPLEQVIDYGGVAFDATATASAALMIPTFDRNTVNQTQVSFRELFDNQYISDELRLIHQQNFLKYKWTPDLSDGQSVQNFKAKYEKLKQLSNYQFANNFYQGEQAHLLDRIPLQYRTEVLFRQPTTYEEFFTYLNTTFHNKRVLANESAFSGKDVKHFKLKANNFQKSGIKIRNYQRSDYQQTRKPYQPRDMSKVKCYNCEEYGHYKRDCQNAKKESFNRFQPKRFQIRRNNNNKISFRGGRGKFQRGRPFRTNNNNRSNNNRRFTGQKTKNVHFRNNPRGNNNFRNKRVNNIRTTNITKEKGNNQKKNFNNKKINHYQEEEEEDEEPQASTSNDQRKYYF
ncbi:7397_t:CDS:1 [Ambispora leptoticha]|uniref:7397_t:CDS:1 n=1 Tax=Ambispora leptoticha TaxID=144679 RepID=A0A9N9EQ66_9GLOM|nr:7397_t:CDS:1 [Ambispora leptoticha]